MSERPKDLPHWALEVSIDPETGVPTRVKPPQEKLRHGWRFKERPPYNWQNWWQYKVYEWIAYFAERLAEPKVMDLNNVANHKIISLSHAAVKITLIGDCTLSFKATAPVQQTKLIIQQDSISSHDIRWVSNVFVENPAPSVQPNSVMLLDVLTFDNGNTYYVRQWGTFQGDYHDR